MGRKSVLIALSGGVDSAVAAWMLQQQGYSVEAAFMRNWHEEDCSASQDLRDAEEVAKILKIKLHYLDFSAEYWQRVFQHFLDEYAACRTPNPDVLCNREIKFGSFLRYAQELGVPQIATGHYVQKITDHSQELLFKGVDCNKDQSYFLHQLNQQQLRATLFPLGKFTKDQIRQIASEIGLPNHAKKGSTGICFIGERKFRQFLEKYLLTRPGKIVAPCGSELGNHCGLMFYTLGQRKGLGIGGERNAAEAPWYVAAKDLPNNRLIVTQDRNDYRLRGQGLICSKISWIAGHAPQFPLSCQAKIRYRQADQEAIIHPPNEKGESLILFAAPQWAIAPGQAVVFYLNGQCLGGATIESSVPYTEAQ